MDDQFVREWSERYLSGRDGSRKGQSACLHTSAKADEIDTPDDIFPSSLEIKRDMGTFPDRLPIVRAQQLGHGI